LTGHRHFSECRRLSCLIAFARLLGPFV